MRQHAVAPVVKGAVGLGVLKSVGLIGKRVAGDLVETAKGQRSEAVFLKRSFGLGAPEKRSDVGRVKNEIGRRGDLARGRARAGRRVDEVGSLRKKRTILDELTAKLLRRDRLLVDLDVGEIGICRSDKTDRRRQRNACIETFVAQLHWQERAVGLFEERAVPTEAR